MADQSLTRYVNELGVLTLLRTHGSASRAEIARRLGLTPATITKLILQLTQRELVREIPVKLRDSRAREPGRPGISIGLNPSGAYFLGIEIGVGILRFALLDLTASIVASSEIRVSRTHSPKATVKTIARRIAQLQKNSRFKGRIRSAGATVPGLVNSVGFVINLPILGWKNVNLLAMLSEAIGLPTLIENNANAAAFGSIYTKPDLPSVCTIFLKLGTGCGGAAIINGRLLRGGAGTAAEFGHIPLTENGHLCGCGRVGCLESWVNLAAIARAFRGTTDLSDAEYASLPNDLVRAVSAGDGAALLALESLTHYLSRGLAALVNTFNPTTIMLGGVMLPILNLCLSTIQERVASAIVPGTAVPDIRLSHLGAIECAVGVAAIAHHNAFDISNLEIAQSDALSEAVRA